MASIPSNTAPTFEGDPNVFATVSGELENFGDKDRIEVTLTAGTTYKFFGSSLSSGATGGNSVVSLLDANGVELASNNNETGSTLNSAFSFIATTTGTYLVEISNSGLPSSYSVAISESRSHERLTQADDTFLGGSSVIIVGDKGDDLINVNATSAFDVLGEQGDDTIIGDSVANHMSGGHGNDTISGGGSGDLLFGDAGNDFINGESGSDEIYGGDGADRLLGDSNDDTILGGLGSDALFGGDDNDTLDGGAGGDQMSGGRGDDRYFVDDARDQLFEDQSFALGGGDDTVFASISFALAQGVIIETMQALGSASISLAGNEFANSLIGNGGANTLNGGGGADVMRGLAGNDRYLVDNAADTVNENGGSGTDLVQSAVSFSLANATRVFGAVENLTLTGASAINGSGNAFANVVTGNSAANILSGGAGNDTLSGGLGNDRMLGDAGNDRLFGGAGIDTLTGGANNDIFVFNTAVNASTNRDVITDFNHVSDAFQLENAIFTRLGAGVHALNPAFFHAGAAAADANDFIVYNQATGVLSYDVNGSGAGGTVAFALLTNHPVLAANDFQVI